MYWFLKSTVFFYFIFTFFVFNPVSTVIETKKKSTTSRVRVDYGNDQNVAQ